MDFFYPFIIFLQPGLLWPQAADFRPAIVAAALGLVVGLSLKSVYPRDEAFKTKPFVYLSLFLLVQVISLFYSGIQSMIDEFNFWLQFFLFVVISIMLMASEKHLRRYIWGMFFGGMVVVLYGIYAVPAWGGYEGTGRAGAYGMYENHNDYSFIIVQLVPYLYVFWRVEQGFLKRWLLLASLAACALGMAMSLSRGGMITLVVQAILIIVFAMEGRKRWYLLPIIATFGLAAIAYQYSARAENQGDRYTAEDAKSSRYELWITGGKMLMSNPFFGTGSRRFHEHARNYSELSGSQREKNSHNTFIEIASGSGFLGIMTFLLCGRHLVRELRHPSVARFTPVVDATRKATIICMYSVALRALLDAKVYDWSIYTLGAIGIACIMLMRTQERAVEAAMAVGPLPRDFHTNASQNLRLGTI